jgi:hypothetical protein
LSFITCKQDHGHERHTVSNESSQDRLLIKASLGSLMHNLFHVRRGTIMSWTHSSLILNELVNQLLSLPRKDPDSIAGV